MKHFITILALTMLASACSDDGAKPDDVLDSVTDDTATDDTATGNPGEVVDPATVKVFTPAEVCALVSVADASTTLGVEVSDATESEMSTPQCSYNFTTADGVLSNLTLAVQRPIEDLGGAAGKPGFDVTTSLIIFDTPYEPLVGVGDEAAVSASESLTIIAVLAGGQVFTIATSAAIDIANVAAFANAVVQGIISPDDASPTDAPSADADALAQAKVQAALDTLPIDWSGTIADDLGSEGSSSEDIVFIACLTPEDYDLDNLDIDSAAVWELDAQGPATGSPFGGTQASLEARIFADAAVATDAYAVLERVLGTDEGRECLAREAPARLAFDVPEGTTLESRVEATTIEGADVGARLIVTFNAGGVAGEIYIDLVAATCGDECTLFATFASFIVPVDQAVAGAMVTAALSAN